MTQRHSSISNSRLWRIVYCTALFLLFLAGLFALLSGADRLLRNKDYSAVQDRFAQYPADTARIVFIGNSHQFNSVSPDLLAEEYGVESFMLATSAQTVPMSYYAAMEAIECQHPETIVFEVSYCANDFRTVTDEMTHCFVDGMPDFSVKRKVVEDLVDPEERVYFYLPLGLYHGRWKDLDRGDYEITQWTSRGGFLCDTVEENTQIPLAGPEETQPMPEEMERYMDLLVELCREENVRLVLYVAPFNGLWDNEEERDGLLARQRIFNYVGEYAKERGVEFHNLFYELDRLGLDPQTDWQDRQHLSTSGRQKFTRYMAENGYLW